MPPPADPPVPRPSAPSSRTVFLTLAAVVAALATGLAACESSSGIGPPDGWEEVAAGQWVRTGADVDGAFRDLSTIESMGLDSASSDVMRYAKEQMLYLYRTSPEIVDSLFEADAAPLFDRSFPSEGFKDEVDTVVNDAKKALLGDGTNVSTYRQAMAKTGSATVPAVYPDSLKAAGVTGRVVVQTYVNAEKQPVAVQLIESVNPTLDALVMRQAATSEYTSAWVVTGPRRGGVAIPNYVRTTVPFE